MKEHYAHFALIGIAAVGLLYLLLKRSGAVASSEIVAEVAPDLSSNYQPYPNAHPIGNIDIGGATTNLTYNATIDAAPKNVEIKPTLQLGGAGGGGCCDPCANQPGKMVSTPTIPESVFNAAADNFSGLKIDTGSSAPSEYGYKG